MGALAELCDALPAYAADLRDSLAELEHDRVLSPTERWGCLMACAMAAGEPTLLQKVAQAAAEPLGERGVAAAKAAVAVTAMNDVYYGAIGALRNPEYATMPSGLKLGTLAHPGADAKELDLWCLSVSTLDRCAPCMDAQEEELRRRGVPPARMQAAMRLAAVVAAVARVLAAERALADGEDDGGDEERRDDDGSHAQPDAADAPDGEARASDGPAGDERSGEERADRPAGTADPAVTAAPHPAPAPGDVSPG